MFILKEMRNVVKIRPSLFSVPRNEAIANELNKKLANKVKIIIHYNKTKMQRMCNFDVDMQYILCIVHTVCYNL